MSAVPRKHDDHDDEQLDGIPAVSCITDVSLLGGGFRSESFDIVIDKLDQIGGAVRLLQLDPEPRPSVSLLLFIPPRDESLLTAFVNAVCNACLALSAADGRATRVLVRVELANADDGYSCRAWRAIVEESDRRQLAVRPRVALWMLSRTYRRADVQVWLGEPLDIAVVAASIRDVRSAVVDQTHVAADDQTASVSVRDVLCLLAGVPIAIGAQCTALARSLRMIVRRTASVSISSRADMRAAEFRDVLQEPLQPMCTDLTNDDYASLEECPVKYGRYAAALSCALRDLSTSQVHPKSPIVLMVLGAGRGPLVELATAAAAALNCTLVVYAIDKNATAVAAMERRRRVHKGSWRGVTIVHADMRCWQAPVRADVIVSELLGSFGCNELSPECLSMALRLVRPNGVLIPSSYTSYMAPLCSRLLWDRARLDGGGGLEQPFVVNMHRAALLDRVKNCFTFVHKAAGCGGGGGESLHRRSKLQFTARMDAVLHGFAGVFSAELYNSIGFDIKPETDYSTMRWDSDRSVGARMLAWYPMFFPIRSPVVVAVGDVVELLIERKTGQGRVWYEWSVLQPAHASHHVHNLGGLQSSMDCT